MSLMQPLFDPNTGAYNAAGKKMRAVFLEEITDGTHVYRLWRKDGKPENEYATNPDEMYYLLVEINGFLVPLQWTKHYLKQHAAQRHADQVLYGDYANKCKFFEDLRNQFGYDSTEERDAFVKEDEVVRAYLNDATLWAKEIHRILHGHVAKYMNALENQGETWPNLIGALILNDLPHALKLKEIFCEKRKEAEKEKKKQRMAAYEDEFNQLNDEYWNKMGAAVSVLKTGGVLKNETIACPVEVTSDGVNTRLTPIILELMREYSVEVPLRTQGWIKQKLNSIEVSAEEPKCESLNYNRYKGCRCPEKIFDYLHQLVSEARAH